MERLIDLSLPSFAEIVSLLILDGEILAVVVVHVGHEVGELVFVEIAHELTQQMRLTLAPAGRRSCFVQFSSSAPELSLHHLSIEITNITISYVQLSNAFFRSLCLGSSSFGRDETQGSDRSG